MTVIGIGLLGSSAMAPRKIASATTHHGGGATSVAKHSARIAKPPRTIARRDSRPAMATSTGFPMTDPAPSGGSAPAARRR